MTSVELMDLLAQVQRQKTETQSLEIKAAAVSYPTGLYDTLSSFSNQDDGGIILFGVDEKKGFEEVGVYDAQDLQKHVVEQCNQMEPKVRPLFTVLEKDNRIFVSAEIPGLDVAERPCFYSGRGRLIGSYVRVGDADEHMTEYEIYSYEAFRKKYQDDIRPAERATMRSLDAAAVGDYLLKVKLDRPRLAQLDDQQIMELMGLTREGVPTVAAVMLFGAYPQAYFPQLCVTAIAVPGTQVGELGSEGERFLDNRRIEGTLTQMLDEAIAFVRKNTKSKTIVDEQSGKRVDKSDYPMTAVREAILNALIHRDYSIHTEGMPIQLILFEDRFELINPGGLYGRLRLDQLGKIQPDTRNPVLAVAMEILKQTENRYSGIPTIYRELALANMAEPEFLDRQGSFTVRFYLYNHVNVDHYVPRQPPVGVSNLDQLSAAEHALLAFCDTPRTRQEIADFLKIKTVTHAIKYHVMPLVERKLIALKYPDRPRSPKQEYTAAQKTNKQ